MKTLTLILARLNDLQALKAYIGMIYLGVVFVHLGLKDWRNGNV